MRGGQPPAGPRVPAQSASPGALRRVRARGRS